MSIENRLHLANVRNIANLQRAPLYRLSVTPGKVVVGHRKISGFRQGFAGVATNKACPACDENIQDTSCWSAQMEIDKALLQPAELAKAEPEKERCHCRTHSQSGQIKRAIV